MSLVIKWLGCILTWKVYQDFFSSRVVFKPAHIEDLTMNGKPAVIFCVVLLQFIECYHWKHSNLVFFHHLNSILWVSGSIKLISSISTSIFQKFVESTWVVFELRYIINFVFNDYPAWILSSMAFEWFYKFSMFHYMLMRRHYLTDALLIIEFIE